MAVRFSGGIGVAGQFRSFTLPDPTINFVAITFGSNSNIYSSPDGITWTLTKSAWTPFAGHGTKVMHDGTKWLVMSADVLDSNRNKFATSPDGVNWTTYAVSGTPFGGGGRHLGGITVSGSTYIGASYDTIYTSTNLTTWNYVTTLGNSENNIYNIWRNSANGAYYLSSYRASTQRFYLYVAPTAVNSWTLQLNLQLTVTSNSSYVNTANMVFTGTKKFWHHSQISSGSGTLGTRVGAKSVTSNDWTTTTGAGTSSGWDGLAYGNGVVLGSVNSTLGLIVRNSNPESSTAFSTANASAGAYPSGFSTYYCVNRLAFGSDKFVYLTSAGMKYSTDNGSSWTLSNLTVNNLATVGSKASV
ncbi:MAG: hypothetical protein HC836_16795 [Richelia sp. RM2_1_2]|nr:hypothetical protein [Richelia sp. RM2_1_2]